MSVHLIVGGFPAGRSAGHDLSTARLRLLQAIAELDVPATVANDFVDLARWLPTTRLLISYTAGPYPDGPALEALDAWLAEGGRWLALHGSAGGKAAPPEPGTRSRAMVRAGHHRTLGAFFLNHPPIRRFRVDVVADAATANPHAARLLRDVPASFDVSDELYLIERVGADTTVLLTTDLPIDPTPPGFGFAVPHDTSLLADGRSRTLGTLRLIERDGAEPGGVAYLALGHCHSPATNIQPFVDASIAADGTTPQHFIGPWDTAAFNQLLRNGIAWGLGQT